LDSQIIRNIEVHRSSQRNQRQLNLTMASGYGVRDQMRAIGKLATFPRLKRDEQYTLLQSLDTTLRRNPDVFA